MAQDVIVLLEDCGTTEGIWITEQDSKDMSEPFRNRLIGRVLAAPVPGFEHIAVGAELEDDTIDEMIAAGVTQVYCRSVLAVPGTAWRLPHVLRAQPRRR